MLVGFGLARWPAKARAHRRESVAEESMMTAFHVSAIDPGSRARRGSLLTAHGRVETPVFMDVGTRATVTDCTPADLASVGAQVVLGNTYHLMLRPGPEVFRRLGGIHKFMGWSGRCSPTPAATRSSRCRRPRRSPRRARAFQATSISSMHMLSPERSIEMQPAIGSDIMMVLDECIDSTSDEPTTRAAMERTHRWALRSLAARDEPARRRCSRSCRAASCPTLRRESAAFLTEHPFDGFAIGGLAVGETRAQREDVTALAAELLPADRPRYLMGVGTPLDLLEAVLAGVDMFDCIMPTQLAQQGTAFTSTGRVSPHARAERALDDAARRACACPTCATFSRAYLHHLFKCSEPLGPRLVSHAQPALLPLAHGATRAHAIERGTFAALREGASSRRSIVTSTARRASVRAGRCADDASARSSSRATAPSRCAIASAAR